MSDAEALPRSLALEGATNVRDLGGWPTLDGRTLRFGRVYRGAALAGLTEADRATLARTGLRAICDFRGSAERARWPSAVEGIDGVVVHELPIEPTVGASLRDIMAMHDATDRDARELLAKAYVSYALDWAHQYRAMFDLLIDGRAPLLFHCTAGKDRTGFGAALLLTALGVSSACVRQDYLATNRLWRPDPDIVGRFPPVIADVLLRVHLELLDAAFAAIDTAYGGFDAYAAQALGLTADRRAVLADALLA